MTVRRAALILLAALLLAGAAAAGWTLAVSEGRPSLAELKARGILEED